MKTVNRKPSTVNRFGGRRQSSGFTLVEMLVVVLLIAVLSGIVFRLTALANERTSKAVTLMRIEKLKAALEEFYAEYGQYPPVPDYPGFDQPMFFEYPDAAQESLKEKAGNIRNANGNASDYREAWDKAPVFTFGLMSFLLPRFNAVDSDDFDAFGNYSGGASAGTNVFGLNKDFKQWSDHNSTLNGDNPRDIAACRRWWPYISDILSYHEISCDCAFQGCKRNPSVKGYTNLCVTVLDGWGNDLSRSLHYRSAPPYQTYELYAISPDGKKIEAHAGH